WVTSVAFNSDGTRLVSAGGEVGKPGEVIVWTLAGGKEPLVLKGHKGTVKGVAYHPDDKLVASASADRTVKLWNIVNGKEEHSFPGPAPFHAGAFSRDGQRLAGASAHRSV